MKTRYTKRRLVAHFLKGSLYIFIISAVANLIVMALNVLIPQIIGVTIDSVLGDEPLDGIFAPLVSALGGTEVLKHNAWIAAVAVVIIALIMAIFRYVQTYSGTCANEKLMQRMRNTLFSHIQRLPLSWHTKHNTGDIIQRCTSDTQTILNFISGQLMQLIRIVALIILSLAVMFTMHWRLAAIAASFIPVIVGYSIIFYAKAGKKFRECDEEEGVLSTLAQENLTGVRVVRAFGRERYERDKFDKQNNHYTGLWIKLERFLALYWTSSDFVAALQLLFIIAAGTVFCIDGNLTKGEFVAFISYNAMLIGPVRQLGRLVSNMSRAGVSLERINEIMSAQPEEYGGDEGELSGDIVFKNVGFEYDEGKPVLTDINLTVPQGSTLGIIGSTGSGKSTLCALLDGLYAPTSGSISVGGKDIRDISLQTLRRSMGLVLQNGYLYSATVAENISFATENPDMNAVRHAAQVACVDGNIESFAKGYDTIVGERGVTLSGGQKQRVCIARTLMRSLPYLIFDDSLSAVDSDTDAAIRENLKERVDSATVIIISHRVTTVMNADNIIVMDGGRIIESGASQELLEKGGTYKRIYDMQTSLPEELKGEVNA